MRRLPRPRRAQAGFTLLELITVVTIIGILAAIAYPSYISYGRTANRSDATTSMTFMAQQLERCYSQNFTYAGCAQVPAGASNSRNNYYTITLNVLTASTYTLVAVANPGKPNNPQLNDTDCASFTMTNGGAQTALNGGGADNTTTCWGSK